MVIDVSTPSVPFPVGGIGTPGNALDVAVSGGYAYVADGTHGGLTVIDIRTPSSPVEVGFYDLPQIAYGVAVSAGYAYVANEEGGIAVFQDCALLFADGFETGDSSTWSLVVGMVP